MTEFVVICDLKLDELLNIEAQEKQSKSREAQLFVAKFIDAYHFTGEPFEDMLHEEFEFVDHDGSLICDKDDFKGFLGHDVVATFPQIQAPFLQQEKAWYMIFTIHYTYYSLTEQEEEEPLEYCPSVGKQKKFLVEVVNCNELFPNGQMFIRKIGDISDSKYEIKFHL